MSSYTRYVFAVQVNEKFYAGFIYNKVILHNIIKYLYLLPIIDGI